MHKRTWIKILIGVCALILIVIAANSILKSVVEKKLRTSLQQFQPFINADFSKAHVNLFNASVQLDSLHVSYDPELKQQHTHEINFSAVTISDIHFFKLFAAKSFQAGTLQLSNAKIKLDDYLLKKNDTLPASVFKKLNLPFKTVSFNAVEIKDVVIFEKKTNAYDTVCTGSIALTGLHLPEINAAFSKDSIHFSNIKCNLKDVYYRLSDYYSVHLKKFYLNSKDSVLQIDALKLVPLVSKFELGEKLGRQADHINASVNTIEISGLDVKRLQQKKFIAAAIKIKNTNAYIFRDRRLPHSNKKQPMPLDYLKQIPFDVIVGEFNLSNAEVTSEEFPKEGEHSGYIKLYHLSVTMKPFRNHAGKNTSHIVSNIKGSIMNAGNIHATIDLSLITGNSVIKGAIDNLNVAALNPSAENLGKFHIESGVLNYLDFQFTATATKATGQVVGEYHDLVIDRLKLTDNGLKKAKFASFLLHKIIIPKNKDASLDIKKRTGKIDYDRDPARLVTFYYLKALLSGVRDSFTFGFVLPG
jgi:hypothetical protein